MNARIQISQFPLPIEDELKFSISDFLSFLDLTIKEALKFTDKPGILLSGGVDSALLVILASKHYSGIPCFVVGQDIKNPDVQAAIRLAKENKLNLFVNILSENEINKIQQELKRRINLDAIYPGDECVFAALELAALKKVTGIIATDGIDEQMGGYWGHRDRNRFPSIKDAFEYFWEELEEKHLCPMERSAKFHNLDINFVYLLPKVIKHLSLISLEDRIKDGNGKAVWKEIAQIAGVPSWVLKRQKRGFVDAFNE